MASAAGAAGAGAGGRQPRRGPAPFASFDHDVSDESSPESKMTFQLPEIREDRAPSPGAGAAGRPRSASSPAPGAGSLQAATAPRIDISRASSSSHHDSRDSSPEMALFAADAEADEAAPGAERARLELGFREDGALDLRSSTEELAFLEPEPAARRSPAASPAPRPAPAPPPALVERRHSRKDSQSSEAALLGVSGRTSRLSSIGSQGSAHSAVSNYSHVSDYSHVSKLSVVSGISRSPSPHKMLLETSFCGPKPIENDREICTDVAERRLLEMAGLADGPAAVTVPAAPRDDRREVKTEATIESVTARPEPPSKEIISLPKAEVKLQKELSNQLIIEEKKVKPRPESGKNGRREGDRRTKKDRPEVYSSKNKSKDIIRIRLKPDHEYEDDDDDDEESDRTLVHVDTRQKPASLDLNDRSKRPAHFSEIINKSDHVPEVIKQEGRQSKSRIPSESSPGISPTPSRKPGRKDHDSRTPSPAGASVSRKSSFCSLFKSRETITSPDSPSAAQLRRKKSLNDGSTRSRSKSRDRSTTPTSNSKIKGSVLSLFKTPKKGASSLSPSSRDSSPVIQNISQKQFVHQHVEIPKNSDKLKYYEEAKDGIIHISLHTPPDEKPGSSDGLLSVKEPPALEINKNDTNQVESKVVEVTTHHEPTKPLVPVQAINAVSTVIKQTPLKKISTKPIQRTVLPDGSIIIPLHSPTDKLSDSLLDEQPLPLKKENLIKSNTKEHIIESSAEEKKVECKDSTKDGCSASKEKEPNRRKKHIIFTTNVGSKEQLFSTQFSITKTPSITSEISESFPSLHESIAEIKCEKGDEAILRDTHITTVEATTPHEKSIDGHSRVEKFEETRNEIFRSRLLASATERASSDIAEAKSNGESHADSSESELSSDVGPPERNTFRDSIVECPSVEEAEKKSLVVTQESFEEELPYVPTTLPLERSVALPILPVRDRAATRVRPLERPRSTTPIHPAALEDYFSDEPRTPDTKTDKLKICLPRAAPCPSAAADPARPAPSAARPWGEFAERALPAAPPRRAAATAAPAKPAWINFEEMPERRKQPKRIQTVPREGEAVVYSYVEPDECRCECHQAAGATPAAGPEPPDDELPLLRERRGPDGFASDSSPECGREPRGAGAGERPGPRVRLATPFTGDLDVARADQESPH